MSGSKAQSDPGSAEWQKLTETQLSSAGAVSVLGAVCLGAGGC